MGQFFGNVQIRKEPGESKEEFIKSLCCVMNSTGLCNCSVDEREITYALAYNEESRWAVLVCEEYESDEFLLNNDAARFAEQLNRCCLSTYVTDSDFATIKMYNSACHETDSVTIGDDYMFEDNSRGTKECWEPILSDGATWDQLSNIFSGQYVFAEDGLYEMAKLIDMTPSDAAFNFRWSSEENSEELFFRKFRPRESQIKVVNR